MVNTIKLTVGLWIIKRELQKLEKSKPALVVIILTTVTLHTVVLMRFKDRMAVILP